MKSTYLLILLGLIFLFSFNYCNNISKKKVLEDFKNINPAQFESEDMKELVLLENTPIKIQIPDWEKEQQLKLSTLFDSIEYVKLSNLPKAIIGDINKIVVQDSCLYILDRYKTKSIKKFSREGEYLATIGNQGQGPKEYIEPTDFIVYDNEIIVCDQFKSDLKFYDTSGNFKYAKRAPFLFLKFAFLSSNQYVFNSFSRDGNAHLPSITDYQIFETDSTFKIDYRGFYKSKDKISNYILENNFYPYREKVFFHPTYSDTIYLINKDHGMQAEYILDFLNGKLPEYYFLQNNNKELMKIQDEGTYPLFSGNYVPTEDYLYFEYTTKKGLNHKVVYSKKTNKIICGSTVLNDINYFFQYNNIRTSTEGNVLVGYMQSYPISDFFKNHSRSEWVDHIGEEYTRIAEGIKSEDNPIILFFKIKDF